MELFSTTTLVAFMAGLLFWVLVIFRPDPS